jgi:hypothetical protein
VWTGAVTIAPGGIRLRGWNRRQAVEHAIEPNDVRIVDRAPVAERLAGLPSIRLELRSARTFVVASAIGVGMVSELLDSMLRVVP